MPRRGAIRRGTASAAALAVVAALAGCGGGEQQDAGEAEAVFPVELVEASFPARQRLAKEVELRLVVRNVGDRTIPNLAVTIGEAGHGTATQAFGRLLDEPGLADASRPAWIVDETPQDGDTAHPNTWARGPLAPDRETTFSWRVTPVEPGDYEVTYQLAGSLTGKSRLELADGEPPRGSFPVHVSRDPGEVRITDDGRAVRVPSASRD